MKSFIRSFSKSISVKLVLICALYENLLISKKNKLKNIKKIESQSLKNKIKLLKVAQSAA